MRVYSVAERKSILRTKTISFAALKLSGNSGAGEVHLPKSGENPLLRAHYISRDSTIIMSMEISICASADSLFRGLLT